MSKDGVMWAALSLVAVIIAGLLYVGWWQWVVAFFGIGWLCLAYDAFKEHMRVYHRGLDKED